MQRTVKRDHGRYRQLYNNDDGERDFEERWEQNDWREYENHRTVFSASEEVKPSFQVKDSRTPIAPTQLYLLRKGDHVGWHRPCGIYWHHAIVTDIDHCNDRIEVIHFSKVNSTCTIVKAWLDVRKEKGAFYRFDYSEDTSRQNPQCTVLKRANARVGETGYKFFKKNCEHFATYCKTGKEDCAQVHWAKGKVREGVQTFATNCAKSGVKLACSVVKETGKQTYKNVAAASATFTRGGSRLAGTVAQEAGRQGYRSVAESTAKVAGAEVVEHVGRASNWVGAGVVAAVETGHCIYDIRQMYKSKKEGKITNKDFKISTTQRVSEGVVGGGAAIGGSILGEWVGGLAGGFFGSFVPVIGTAVGAVAGAFFGSVVGGAIGSFAGKVLGTLFGNWFGRKLFG